MPPNASNSGTKMSITFAAHIATRSSAASIAFVDVTYLRAKARLSLCLVAYHSSISAK